MTKRQKMKIAEAIFYRQQDASDDSDLAAYQDVLNEEGIDPFWEGDDSNIVDEINDMLVVVAAKHYAKLAGGKFIPKGKK